MAAASCVPHREGQFLSKNKAGEPLHCHSAWPKVSFVCQLTFALDLFPAGCVGRCGWFWEPSLVMDVSSLAVRAAMVPAAKEVLTHRPAMLPWRKVSTCKLVPFGICSGGTWLSSPVPIPVPVLSWHASWAAPKPCGGHRLWGQWSWGKPL